MAQLSTTMIQLSFYFILMFGLLAFIYLLFDLNTQRSSFNGNARHQSVSISGSSMTKQRSTVDVAIRSFVDPRIITYNQILRNLTRNNIDLPSGEDAFVFLHIQKTAGTSFERFLVKKLNTTVPCICEVSGKKRCNCRNKQGKIWLFSRYSTGWVHSFACGLHADFTQLMASRCVDNYFQREEGKRKNRLYLTTFLREPIDRFISEYSHVQRGATWKGARHFCNGRLATLGELPPCYDHGKVQWNVSGLDEFLACPHNLAFNRQTRMLTDLTLVNCYNKSSMEEQIRNEKMLASAIDNLRRFAFFGIKEQMAESQFLFEATFDLRFDGNLAEWNKSKSAHIEVNADQLASIRSKNQLDLRLYEFARELFHQRLNRLGWSSHQKQNDQVMAAGG